MQERLGIDRIGCEEGALALAEEGASADLAPRFRTPHRREAAQFIRITTPLSEKWL
jgi:hypothetical protein